MCECMYVSSSVNVCGCRNVYMCINVYKCIFMYICMYKSFLSFFFLNPGISSSIPPHETLHIRFISNLFSFVQMWVGIHICVYICINVYCVHIQVYNYLFFIFFLLNSDINGSIPPHVTLPHISHPKFSFL